MFLAQLFLQSRGMLKIIWEANPPYSQLRAELRRAGLQSVQEADMQGRLWNPAINPL